MDDVGNGSGEGSSPLVVYFVSDHGFGHASRSMALLMEFLRRDTEVVIVSNVPRWFFRESLGGWTFDHIATQVDVGVHQKTSVEIDYEMTLRRLEELWDGMQEKVETLAEELRARVEAAAKRRNCRVVFDISAMAPLVAEKLGVPSIAISHFTWDWIYEPFVERYPRFQTFIDLHRRSYAKVPCPLVITIYHHCHLDLFSRKCPDILSPAMTRQTTMLLNLSYSEIKNWKCPKFEIPWLVRGASLEKATVRNRIGFDHAKKYCLYSFGGHVFPLESVHQWQVPEEWSIILMKRDPGSPQKGQDSVIFLSQEQLNSLEIRYVDLINAVDLVVCKTGYGIVSECIRHSCSVLFTDRPGFVEHQTMARALRENVNAEEVTLNEVLEASPSLWEKAKSVVPNTKQSRYPFDGAQKAADLILSSDWLSDSKHS